MRRKWSGRLTGRKLRLVDVETGELHNDDPLEELQYLKDQIKGLERDVRAWRIRYAKLARDEEQRAMSSELWPVGKRLFILWKDKCRHPRSKWTPDRFLQCERLLKEYGEDICIKAIEGAAYDPYVTQMRNGGNERHDGWGQIFKNAEKLERFANRAPRRRAKTNA